jgi:nitroimidazol reductase NimA-like FMN-containing flavoprotein (pyridoxamine 5'-phosphate oxidase superfamily)
MAPRTKAERKRDALERLLRDRDLWIATSGNDGSAYLVPLSYSWDGQRIVLISAASSPTMSNLERRRSARLALGDTRDVIMIDVELESLTEVRTASAEILDAYERQAGWRPQDSENQILAIARPLRIQVWREADEIADRTVMVDGAWVI